ncbi:MAG: 2-succinyl-5-enolpyruvyl-6-hydroxy-3-cyclohexene-1-carboxylic-acid synthase [Verrucomicrobia bacterium]|jgi:2-succinyl-5-enolpyruvyl-6-hydroxy-3-cyclohexene-1-carboxylate synthase|nr:2-succinyl-5-enolpyruvyl-6-hydroxy-3-cyclohexene-1-carboxylic-acid synthase [Verrucomicrobiota bacterium]
MRLSAVPRNDQTEPFDILSRSTVNAAWAALAMEVLARLGVETVITSPGSRSTPLTFAAARNPRLEALTILDERSAAFYALGLAKRTHRPVALVCTSGSAAANYWPAVVEASMSGTPLLLLTADRPPELRQCSSGQTIDQLKLYGDFVRAFHEVALPEASAPLLDYLRQTLVHAVNRSLRPDAGPVHLNFPFRDPLVPDPAAQQSVFSAEVMESAATVQTRPCESVLNPGRMDDVALERMSSHPWGIIVVGSENPVGGDEAFADAVAMISRKLGWPVLADVLNPLRHHGGENTAVVAHYDAILRDPAHAKALQPTAVLQIGSLPTSKVLRKWLESLDAVSFLSTNRPINTDPLHRVATPVFGDAHALAGQLQHQKPDEDWAKGWMTAEESTAARIDLCMENMDTSFEGKVAWLLSRHLPVGASVFLASSMPVRYAEYFWSVSSRAYSVFANRGANGIDGTLSTSLGVAHGGKPAVLLTGDLAFLHDSNGLLAAGQLTGSLTIVMINNDGGGIFEHLPVAAMDPPFEQFFATPQTVDFEGLCRTHKVEYQRIAGWAALVEAVGQLPASGIRVLEVQTDRKADREQLSDLFNTESARAQG